MPNPRMTLCNRLIGGVVDGLMIAIDTITSFWQTPREVEWAKAAADGLAEREAEEEVAEPHTPQYVGYVDSDGVTRVERAGVKYDDAMERHHRAVRGLHEAITALVPETSAPTPGAVDAPAEGEPPEPSAGVGANSPKWLRDLIEATENYVGAPPGSLSSPLESVEHAAAVVDVEAGGVFWYAEDDLAHSAAVESPASVPAAECSAPEFDWVTTAIPVIAGVLAEHMPDEAINGVDCIGHGETHGEFADWRDWRDHVAPHIAAALQTVCNTTVNNVVYNISLADEPLETISRAQEVGKFPSGDRPRPLGDFPKHQNPRM